VAGTPPITIPLVLITIADGAEIDNRIAAGPVTMTWTNTVVSEPNPTGGLISNFSSYGPAPDLSLKPDIGAPGGTVRSTLPLEMGGAGLMGGTSMAAPHVAGAVALLLEARSDLHARQVRDLLQNNADPRLWFGNPALGLLETVPRQGAGMLNIVKAIRARTSVAPGKISLGEIESGTVIRKLAVRLLKSRGADDDAETSNSTVTYTLGHEPALATGVNTFSPSFLSAFANVGFSSPTVTIGGRERGKRSFYVTFTPPADASARLFGGYITLTPNDGGPVLRVPYSGYNGDYQGISALVPTANNFPWLARPNGSTFTNLPNGSIFTLVGDDVPYVLVHLDHPVERLRLAVFDAATGRARGFALKEEFVSRNSGAATFFALPWDGTVAGGERVLPDGTYHIGLSVLKALGDKHADAHWERWTSPDFTIARPPRSTAP
jgi:hypothetical protein